jgi:hypothetical protein
MVTKTESKTEAPDHCGQKMKYIRVNYSIAGTDTVHMQATFQCIACKHEEIIKTSYVPECDPDILKRGAEVISRAYAYTVAETKRLEASIAERKKRLQPTITAYVEKRLF